MSVSCWAATDTGYVRHRNEDSYAIAGSDLNRATHWSGILDANEGWALVADGMGGHAGGKVASQLAVDILRDRLTSAITEADIQKLVNITDDTIRDAMLSDPSCSGMGTTIAAALYRSKDLICFNVGDSRIYSYLKGSLRQLSVDHAIDGRLLTQCLGGSLTPRPLSPGIANLRRCAGLRLLLCTDGLTGLVSDQVIRTIMGRNDNPAKDLVAAALAAGGHDNVTAIVLEF